MLVICGLIIIIIVIRKADMVYGRNLTHRDLIVSGLNLLQTILSKRFTLLEIHYFQPSNLLLCIFLNCKVIPHNNTLQYSPYFNIMHSVKHFYNCKIISTHSSFAQNDEIYKTRTDVSWTITVVMTHRCYVILRHVSRRHRVNKISTSSCKQDVFTCKCVRCIGQLHCC